MAPVFGRTAKLPHRGTQVDAGCVRGVWVGRGGGVCGGLTHVELGLEQLAG